MQAPCRSSGYDDVVTDFFGRFVESCATQKGARLTATKGDSFCSYGSQGASPKACCSSAAAHLALNVTDTSAATHDLAGDQDKKPNSLGQLMCWSFP